jgi:dihydroorotate dehydrogenase
MPIVGVGGVFSASDAWEKILLGASLIQVYTGYIYEGAGLPRRINEGLLLKMKQEGVRSLAEVRGQADPVIMTMAGQNSFSASQHRASFPI